MKVGVTVPMVAGDVPDGQPFPSWATIRAFAERAEALGLDSLWVYDHLLIRRAGQPTGGIHESWTIASALAAVTRRVTLGQLVMATPFRNPALLSKMAVALDEVSGGRTILGIGSGWHEPEFEAFGYPFDHRVGRFEEATAIIRRLLDGETVTDQGRWHSVREVVLAPAPARRIPLLIAAKGPRMMRLTARYADAWNVAWHGHPDDAFHAKMTALDEALDAARRDPATLRRTSGIILRDPAQRDATASPAAAFGGSVEEIAEVLDEHAAAGIDEAIFWLEPKSDASLERLAEAVAIQRRRTGASATIGAP